MSTTFKRRQYERACAALHRLALASCNDRKLNLVHYMEAQCARDPNRWQALLAIAEISIQNERELIDSLIGIFSEYCQLLMLPYVISVATPQAHRIRTINCKFSGFIAERISYSTLTYADVYVSPHIQIALTQNGVVLKNCNKYAEDIPALIYAYLSGWRGYNSLDYDILKDRLDAHRAQRVSKDELTRTLHRLAAVLLNVKDYRPVNVELI